MAKFFLFCRDSFQIGRHPIAVLLLQLSFAVENKLRNILQKSRQQLWNEYTGLLGIPPMCQNSQHSTDQLVFQAKHSPEKRKKMFPVRLLQHGNISGAFFFNQKVRIAAGMGTSPCSIQNLLPYY
jgi:hypothetical protein